MRTKGLTQHVNQVDFRYLIHPGVWFNNVWQHTLREQCH